MSSNESRSRGESRIRAGQTVRVVIWLVVLAALVDFAALHTDEVSVDWAFDTTDVALWIVIEVSAATGVVIGYFREAQTPLTARPDGGQASGCIRLHAPPSTFPSGVRGRLSSNPASSAADRSPGVAGG
jgi:hypothetical protein